MYLVQQGSVITSPEELQSSASVTTVSVTETVTPAAITPVAAPAVSAPAPAPAAPAPAPAPTAPAAPAPTVPAGPVNTLEWGINSQTSNLFSAIAVDSQQNVYTIGNINFVGTNIYNYSMITSDVVTQSVFGTLQTAKVSSQVIIKYNSSGQVQWVNYIEPPVSTGLSIYNYRIHIDANDDVVLSIALGYANNATSYTLTINEYTGKDGSNILTFQPVGSFTTTNSVNSWIFKIQNTGSFVWMNKLDNPFFVESTEQINDLAIDSNSNIYVVGWFFANTTSLTQSIMMLYNSASMQGTNANIVFTQYGQLQIPNTGNSSQGFIIKYNSSGQPQWVHMFLNTWKTANVRYSAQCQTIMIDSNDMIIVRGILQSIGGLNVVSGITVPTPVANQVSTWNYSTTGQTFSPSLYTFGQVIPANTSLTPTVSNYIEVNLAAQISLGSVPSNVNPAILMKFNPSGALQWINYMYGGGTSIYKSTAFDSQNHFFMGFQQGTAAIPLYTPLTAPTTGTVWEFQTNGNTIDPITMTNNVPGGSINICKIDSNGNIVAVAKLYSTESTIILNTAFLLHTSSNGELFVSGYYGHSGTTKHLFITNFVGLNGTTAFTPTTQLYAKLPIVQDTDIYMIKYDSNLQGAWALNINTGTNGTANSLNDIYLSATVNQGYIYLGVRYPIQALKLQAFTGINPTTQLVEQSGSLTMAFNGTPVNGTSITQNNALLKFST